MSLGGRLRRVALAGLAGWATGALVTTPFQIVELARNAGGDARLMADSLGLGLILWAIWTLAISFFGLVAAGIPVAIWVSPQWLLQHRRVMIVGSVVSGFLVAIWKFRAWEALKPEPFYDMPLIAMYGTFAAVFGGVTALLYLRMLQKDREQQPG
jgi:hypothetical protein